MQGAAILGDLLSSGLGVQGMLWSTSPACTELESHVLDWLVEALALPAAFRCDGPGGGVIQDSASSATLCALLAARHRSGGDISRLTVYASEQAHSSVEKAVRIAGLPDDAFRAIPTDSAYAARASFRTRGSLGGRPRTCPKLRLDQRRFVGQARYDSCEARPTRAAAGLGGTLARTQASAR